MKQNKNIEAEIAEIEKDLDVLRASIDKYDTAREGAETSGHIEDLLSSLKEIEQELHELPEIVEKLGDNRST